MPTGIKTLPQHADYTVALILDAERDRQGTTQAELATAVGISQPQMSRVLNGLRPMTIGEMLGICKALGLVASAVVEQAEHKAR